LHENIVSNSLVCWRCGASLSALSLPLRRLDVCKACNFFKPKSGAYVAKNTTEVDRAKAALDDLFRK
jgi:hypothetical protein